MRQKQITLIFAGLFLLLSIAVWLIGEDFYVNAQLLRIINGSQTELLNSIMKALTEYGREYFWIPVLLLLWIFGHKQERKTAFLIAIAFVLAIILGELAKFLIVEPRPGPSIATILLPRDTDSSFPSGHALIVSTGAILALTKLRKLLSLPLILEALLVSYSRVYGGAHWPVDILSGWLLGGFCASLIVLYEVKLNSPYEYLLNLWIRITGRK